MICTLCPKRLSDGSKQVNPRTSIHRCWLHPRWQHLSYLWLSTSSSYFTLRSRPQPHPLLCNMLCAVEEPENAAANSNQKTEGGHRTEKSFSSSLTPFPFENFGFATWFTAIKARNLFLLIPASKEMKCVYVACK